MIGLVHKTASRKNDETANQGLLEFDDFALLMPAPKAFERAHVVVWSTTRFDADEHGWQSAF